MALDPINKEFTKQENLGVISKVDYSEWSSQTVHLKKKNNTIRVCIDFSTGLNESLQNYNYPLLTPEEIFPKLNDGNFFSKLDLSDAYQLVEVFETTNDYY